MLRTLECRHEPHTRLTGAEGTVAAGSIASAQEDETAGAEDRAAVLAVEATSGEERATIEAATGVATALGEAATASSLDLSASSRAVLHRGSWAPLFRGGRMGSENSEQHGEGEAEVDEGALAVAAAAAAPAQLATKVADAMATASA